MLNFCNKYAVQLDLDKQWRMKEANTLKVYLTEPVDAPSA